jgi:hypothetical protein
MYNGKMLSEQDLKDEQRYLPPGSQAEKPDPEAVRRQRRIVVFAVLAVIILVLVLVGGTWFLYTNPARAAVVRDIFIIFMALETMLIGLTLVILIVQLARLINLLQNEIKPILDSTNETVSTMRGTITFLSDNLAEPVVKLNETFAAFGEVRKFLKTIRGK